MWNIGTFLFEPICDFFWRPLMPNIPLNSERHPRGRFELAGLRPTSLIPSPFNCVRSELYNPAFVASYFWIDCWRWLVNIPLYLAKRKYNCMPREIVTNSSRFSTRRDRCPRLVWISPLSESRLWIDPGFSPRAFPVSLTYWPFSHLGHISLFELQQVLRVVPFAPLKPSLRFIVGSVPMHRPVDLP